MKVYVSIALLALAAGIAGYLLFSFLNVARERIRTEDLPQGTYEIIRWLSDAGASALILKDPAGQTPVIVNRGLGKTEPQGFRSTREALEALPGGSQVQRIINSRTGQPLAYIVASERLEIHTGFSILKRQLLVSISDPEDSHHQKQREGP